MINKIIETVSNNAPNHHWYVKRECSNQICNFHLLIAVVFLQIHRKLDRSSYGTPSNFVFTIFLTATGKLSVVSRSKTKVTNAIKGVGDFCNHDH